MPLGAIDLRGLTWRPLGRVRPTLTGLDLRVGAGERVLLVGPSGAGKSTILLALAGALGTTLSGELSGEIHVDGRIGLLPQNPLDAVVAEKIGRDVAFGPENAALSRREIWRRVDAALDAVALPYGRDHPVGALSGGEQQRLALAGVLAVEPDVLLLDEPTSMLDAATAAQVRDAVLATASGRTLLVVEHRFEPWLDHVDRVIVLGPAGEIVSDGTVAAFLGGPNPPGVWMPGMARPVPAAMPSSLVAPGEPPSPVRAVDVGVELITRGLRSSLRTQALSGFGLEVTSGTTTALVGPSGAGKSTALAALGGLRRPTSGSVQPTYAALRSRELARRVGWVPQNPEHGFLAHRVRDEVELTSRRLGVPVDVDAVLDVVGLGPLAEAHPFRLSGGEQQRLALAASLAHRPGLCLLDEPTVGQDPHTWASVTGWMAAARDAGAIVVAATHDDDLPADRRVVLR